MGNTPTFHLFFVPVVIKKNVGGESVSAEITDYLRKRSGADQHTTLAARTAAAVEESQPKREAKQI